MRSGSRCGYGRSAKINAVDISLSFVYVMSGNNYKIGKLGVLAPAALSACMDASVLAVPAAGAIVSTVLKELSKAFMLKKWFHGSLTAKEAENLMMERGKNGSYLVRESRGHPGDYVLSVRVRGRVIHVMIKKQDNKYDVGSGEKFDDLVSLIEHFRSYPMIETSGDVLRLIQPVNGNYLRSKLVDRKKPVTPEMERANEEPNEYSKEFTSIQLADDTRGLTTFEALKAENLIKNRYKNILPYDQTRVILQKDYTDGNDYINANFITSQSESLSSVQSSNESIHSAQSLKIIRNVNKLNVMSKSLSDEALKELKHCLKMDKMNGNIFSETIKHKKYIATQGCLQSTISDFWRMVWQEDVQIIVMITKEVENGKKKCERYWPESSRSEHYADLDIRLITEASYDDYVVRELLVSNDIHSRTIYQYQYTTWPDHGTPSKASSILGFIVDINTRMNFIENINNKTEQNTLCVHCSAGVGRTGTFIVLDMLINKINESGLVCDVNVCNTVKWVRRQRNGMVQNKSQYKFIYLALQEYIDCFDLRRSKKVSISSYKDIVV